jgi:hypothetical protein
VSETAEPCAHPGNWTPEAFVLDGGKVVALDVTCAECGWSGRVGQNVMMRAQGYLDHEGRLWAPTAAEQVNRTMGNCE